MSQNENDKKIFKSVASPFSLLMVAISVMVTNNCFSEEKKTDRQTLIEEAKSGNIGAMVMLGYEDPYLAETNFKCGKYSVRVSTSCRKIDQVLEWRAICYAQHFEISSEKKITDFFLFNADYKNELMIAGSVFCSTDETHSLLRIYSGNFSRGERNDYFDESAHYLGSYATYKKRAAKIVSGYKQMSDTEYKKWVKLRDDKKMNTKKFKINTYPIITGDHSKW